VCSTDQNRLRLRTADILSSHKPTCVRTQAQACNRGIACSEEEQHQKEGRIISSAFSWPRIRPGPFFAGRERSEIARRVSFARTSVRAKLGARYAHAAGLPSTACITSSSWGARAAPRVGNIAVRPRSVRRPIEFLNVAIGSAIDNGTVAVAFHVAKRIARGWNGWRPASGGGKIEVRPR